MDLIFINILWVFMCSHSWDRYMGGAWFFWIIRHGHWSWRARYFVRFYDLGRVNNTWKTDKIQTWGLYSLKCPHFRLARGVVCIVSAASASFSVSPLIYLPAFLGSFWHGRLFISQKGTGFLLIHIEACVLAWSSLCCVSFKNSMLWSSRPCNQGRGFLNESCLFDMGGVWISYKGNMCVVSTCLLNR